MSRDVEWERDAALDLKKVFDVSLDMLCIRDMQGRFVKVNRAWEATLGYTVEELEGAPLLPLIHPDDLAATRATMQDADLDGVVVGFVNRYRHRDGHYRHLEWRASKMGDRIFGVARDVTERLAMEADLRAAKLAAEAANQAKSDFLANMSHEIRTPLNGVIGVAAALALTELTAAQREMAQLILSSGEMLERLVSDVLEVSKIEAGRLELETRDFDLRRELEGVIEVHRSRANEKGLSFRIDYGENARGEFLGDKTRIKQIVGNLLSNAVKFTVTGEVGLRVEIAGAGEGAPVRATFEVSDTGVGFDAETGARLFQRFVQADSTITRRFGGTGLGLSICRSLAELMGGEISARSEPGRGSCFTLVLPLERSRPLAECDAAEPTERPEAHGATSGANFGLDRPLRVLVADDHPVNRKVVALVLEPFGAELVMVDDGAAAVEAFSADVFDVVLMDMQMPVLDGLAATVAIRRLEAGGPRTPVIMLSANAMQQHREAALAAGADVHLAKPVSAAALVAGIGQALSHV